MLGSKQRNQARGPIPMERIGKMCSVQKKAGVVGYQADPLSFNEVRKLREQKIGPGFDLG